MGGKSSPNYGDLAVQQGEANAGVVRDQTYANRPTQMTPWGYTSWTPSQTTDPGTGESVTSWTQTQGLTPELQSILDRQVAIQGARTDMAGGLVQRAGSEFGTPMDFANLNPLAATPQAQFTLPEGQQTSLDFSGAPDIGDPERLRERAENAIYGRAQSRLAPQFDQRRQALEIKLRNQGLGPEDEAWQAQMGGLNMQETDAYNQAMFSAIDTGRAEAGQLFGQDVTRRGVATGEATTQGNFTNDALRSQFGQNLQANQSNFGQATQNANYSNAIRQQQLTEMLQQRGASLNEINALLSGQQVNTPQMPNFATASSAAPAPIYQAGVDQGNYNAAMDPLSGLLGAGATLGAAYLGRPGG